MTFFVFLGATKKRRRRRRFGNSKRGEREDWGKKIPIRLPPPYFSSSSPFSGPTANDTCPYPNCKHLNYFFRLFRQIILWEGVIVLFTFCSCFDLCLWTTGHEEKSFSFCATEEKEGGLGPTNQPIKTGPFHSPKKKKKGAFEGLFVITPFLFFRERDVCVCVSVWKKRRRGKGTNTHSTFSTNNILFVKK